MNSVINRCGARQDHQKKANSAGISSSSQRTCGLAKVIGIWSDGVMEGRSAGTSGQERSRGQVLFHHSTTPPLHHSVQSSRQSPEYSMPQKNFQQQQNQPRRNHPGKQFLMVRELFDLRLALLELVYLSVDFLELLCVVRPIILAAGHLGNFLEG